MKTGKLNNYFTLVQKMILYNLRIIFANKFIWFLAGSVVFYLGISVIYVISEEVSRMSDLYGVFIFAYIIMLIFTYLSSVLIVKFQFVRTTTQVMVPVLFLGMMAFMLSTVI